MGVFADLLLLGDGEAGSQRLLLRGVGVAGNLIYSPSSCVHPPD